ncbi:hypothetical protein JCM25156A_07880 [Komagataeibacter kakiaceti JCM 25156]
MQVLKFLPAHRIDGANLVLEPGGARALHMDGFLRGGTQGGGMVAGLRHPAMGGGLRRGGGGLGKGGNGRDGTEQE